MKLGLLRTQHGREGSGCARGHLLLGIPRAEAGLMCTVTGEGRAELWILLCAFREKEAETGNTEQLETIRVVPALLIAFFSVS